MITIGTVKFDFVTDNQPFARKLNGNWDHFFSTSFERVVEEVLSAYDISDQVITIESLPIDLGSIDEDNFDSQFPVRLRKVIAEYARKYLSVDILPASKDIHRDSISVVALDTLCFFLLHGYLPNGMDVTFSDLHFLLSKTIEESAYLFREFLERYGHYDFLSKRLVYSFSDEELDRIVHVVQPSESKFIILYVRAQLHSYEIQKRPDIGKSDYHNVVWILVLAYLFSESGSRFGRKQLILHTLRGVAAHFNFTFSDMVNLLTAGMEQLEQTTAQLPELWSILKEIRRDVQTEFHAFCGDYRKHLLNGILSALHSDKPEKDYMLSYEHLYCLLSDSLSCRELLGTLQEPQIYRIVGIVNATEKDYIISYARLLDHHKEAGAFAGKLGSDFRILKWEFIFAVLISLPASTFNRKLFVLSVLQRLAAHYNLTVVELLCLLVNAEELKNTYLDTAIYAVLQALNAEMNTVKEQDIFDTLPVDDFEVLLQIPGIARRAFNTHTEDQIICWVNRFAPAYSEFIVGYAAMLEKGRSSGLMEGKAGSEFRSLKWEFIFSFLLYNKGGAFHQKMFVYTVLKLLAAHYNQEVTDLIGYFLQNLSEMIKEPLFTSLKFILKELYEEYLLPLADKSVIRAKTDGETELWALQLFGVKSMLSGVSSHGSYQEKWLIYFLNERTTLFRHLWRTGQLNTPLLLQLVNSTPSLRNLWLRRIGDERLLTIYRDWLAAFSALRSRFRQLSILESVAEYLARWMVELTSRSYSSWSENEVIHFLATRMRQSLPSGFTTLMDEMHFEKNRNISEIINWINQLKKENVMDNFNETIEVNNAGLVIITPYFLMLFHRMGYLSDDRRSFKDEESKEHAIFLLQYLIYGEQREWPETELFLNKLIVGRSNDRPLPRALELTKEETDMADQLIEAIRQNWNKMRNTSLAGLRTAFFQRRGYYSFDKDTRKSILKVEERAYDILLDSIPWGFRLMRFPWAEFMLEVKWRQ